MVCNWFTFYFNYLFSMKSTTAINKPADKHNHLSGSICTPLGRAAGRGHRAEQPTTYKFRAAQASEVRFYRETSVSVNPMSQLSGNHLINCFNYR